MSDNYTYHIDPNTGSSVFVYEGDQDGIVFDNAIKQALKAAESPIVNQISLMPDAHYGSGNTTVGAVYKTSTVAPELIGGDIGCGMYAVPITNLSKNELDLDLIYQTINSVIPTGTKKRYRKNNPSRNAADPGTHAGFTGSSELYYRYKIKCHQEFYKSVLKAETFNDFRYYADHMGTLGGGNHFIELCEEDTTGTIWLVVHSGSRGFGGKIGKDFTKLAKDLASRYFLPDKGITYLPKGDESVGRYMRYHNYALKFAAQNRHCMLRGVMMVLRHILGNSHPMEFSPSQGVFCHHNYFEHVERGYIARKGAVKAAEGQRVLIPGSMGRGTYIGVGTGGDKYSLESCSHGAGRTMSRSKFKRAYTLDQHQQSLEGIVCDNSDATLDESPDAYKDLEAVMRAQKALVTIESRLSPLLNVKGIEHG